VDEKGIDRDERGGEACRFKVEQVLHEREEIHEAYDGKHHGREPER